MKWHPRSPTLIRTALLWSCCIALVVNGKVGSSTSNYRDKVFDRELELQRTNAALQRRLQQDEPLCQQCLEIDIIFHIIQPDAFSSNLDTFIDTQVAELNKYYNSTPFRFKKKATTQTINTEWKTSGIFDMSINQDALATNITATLRVGGPDVANIFLVEGVPCPVFGGFTSMPGEKGMFPSDMYSKTDYIFLCPSYTGWKKSQYPLILHEMGHWLGLLHVFEKNGDLVDDTPVQQYPSGVCAEGEVHNIMDYSICGGNITKGQIQRMYETFRQYRRPQDRCNNDETQVHLQVHLDDRPENAHVEYSTWGEENGHRYEIMSNVTSESQIDFDNQVLSRTFCIPRQTLYEFRVRNANITLQMNGRSLIQSAAPTSADVISVWVAGDSSECPTKSRFELELNFDSQPNYVGWQLIDASIPSPVLDWLDTVAYSASEYYANLAGNTLFVDFCVDVGDFEFSIWDDRNQPLRSTYRLALDGQELPHGDQSSLQSTFFTVTPDFAQGAAAPETPGETKASVETQVPNYCFSGMSTVQVQHRLHRTSMDDLLIGDVIHVGNGAYETVYAFGHRSPNGRADFLQITTNGTISKGNLVMSPDHMVFLAEGGPPVPAGLLQVGNSILDLEGNQLTVQAISKVASRGQYAPFTPSGMLEVDGVLVSSFVALEQSPSLSLFAGGASISFQWLSHSFEFPHRVACYHFGACLDEHYTLAEGISVWVSRPHHFAMWLLRQSSMVRSVAVGMMFPFLMMFNVLEWLILNRYFALQIVGVLVLIHAGNVKSLHSLKHQTR